jgi:hypothetical protein
MPGHFSSAYLNLGTGTEDLPTPTPAKRAHVSLSSPSEDVAEVKPVLSPSQVFPVPLLRLQLGIEKLIEGGKRQNFLGMPYPTCLFCPLLAILQIHLGLTPLGMGNLDLLILALARARDVIHLSVHACCYRTLLLFCQILL